MSKYVCDMCGWEYDPAEGYPEGGIEPGTPWEEIPDDFVCPMPYLRRRKGPVLSRVNSYGFLKPVL